ncbi:2-methoxy-6-polyprenyl-1,4-benzoquinol methylase, mitochondrial isoform X2 [Heptranchias perlo]|uniref:2-methoxy-6-polyprenyl-1,4-benzoquinol methylase, mitochondrial isoform X2 n=1 Tax=Heptranchias perlo TaxID=212740 RepID=UPI00355A712F
MAACRLLRSFVAGPRGGSGLFTCSRNLAARVSVRVHSGNAEEKQTDFGFERVSESEKAEKGDIAFRFMDYIRSQHERQSRQTMKSYQSPSWQQINDLYQQQNESDSDLESKAVICDINKEMLKVGRQKAEQLKYTEGLSWVVGNAEELPFDDDKFDVYTIAFGIRNVTHIDHVLQEAYRVLKPGGRFLCLEFSKVQNPILSRLYNLYSFQVIPVLGEVIAADWKSYQYLVESIQRFPDQEEFKAMIEDAGFYKVEYNNLTSGIVAVHSGFKL